MFNLLYADTQLEDREFPIASSEVEMFLFLQTFRRCIYIYFNSKQTYLMPLSQRFFRNVEKRRFSISKKFKSNLCLSHFKYITMWNLCPIYIVCYNQVICTRNSLWKGKCKHLFRCNTSSNLVNLFISFSLKYLM